MKPIKFVPWIFLILGLYMAGTSGIPTFMNATTLTELLKGLIISVVGIVGGVACFRFAVAMLE